MTGTRHSGQTVNRRTLLKGATALAAGSALGASMQATPATASQASGKLVVASFYPTNEASGWDGLLAAFAETYPDVEIEVQVTSDEYLAKILSQQASGTLPDILAVENNEFPRFADAGLLLALDDRVAATEDFTKEDFPARLIERFTFEDQLFGIPYDVQPIAGVFLNKAVFAEAGVELPTAEWTWDEFMGLAEALTVKDGDRTTRYGFDPGVDNWQNWIYAHGGRLVDNAQAPTVVTTDSPEAIAGMQAYVDLSLVQGFSPKRELFAGGGVASGDLFAAGQTAMFLGGYWEVVSYPGRWDGIDLGYLQLPVGPSGETGFATGGTCYSVSSGSQNPDIAFEFVQFFMGMEGWRAASEASATIYPPAYIPAFEEIFLADPNNPVENKALNGTAAEFAIFGPADPVWTEIRSTRIDPDLDLLASGEADVTETLTTWATEFTPMLTANQ